jgi:hypothetical protein
MQNLLNQQSSDAYTNAKLPTADMQQYCRQTTSHTLRHLICSNMQQHTKDNALMRTGS